MTIQASNLAERLAARTLELVDISSESRSEAALAGHIRSLLADSLELVQTKDDAVYARVPRAGRPRVLFIGHLDTIPAQGNLPGRIEDGAVIGLGASDMKAGLAVMIELAGWIGEEGPELALAPAFLFFPREELTLEESSLPELFAAIPELDEAELVIVMEPTDNEIQAGCLGNLYANIVFRGESAHSARPWQGENAIAKAIAGLTPLLEIKPLELEQEGLKFSEVLSVTGIESGIAANVIPDICVARVNYRYAPTRAPEEAEARLRELVGAVAELELTSNSPPAHVPSSSPLLERLRRTGDLDLRPKQAWTPVAEFSGRGLDAVNFGPGATRYAHRADERVESVQLERSFTVLRRFLSKEI
ncbi:MAG: succinyl-diaminopimelate desuccinylase [Gaiellaceae bacterium]|jgi:succinyl-diaminopimelate desuccinylase